MSRPLFDGTNKNSNVVQIRSGITIDTTHTEHQGVLTKIVHANDKGFFIGVIGGVTCLGNLYDPKQGYRYLLTDGEFTYSDKFSQHQFKFNKYTESHPEHSGLEDYLIRECPGLGPVFAKMISREFKDRAIEMLAEHPIAVTAHCKGISSDNIFKASEWAKGEKSNADMKTRLYGIGILPSQVQKLIVKYGNHAERQIRHNCFSLTEIHGFGFLTVDKIADLIGVPKNDPGRIKACLMYMVESLTQESGHTCIAVRELIKKVCETLRLEQSTVLPVLQELMAMNQVIASTTKLSVLSEELGIIQ